METWVLYAILSMIFAGITAILAKYGLQNINPDMGLGIRTATIFVLVTAFTLLTNKFKDLPLLTGRQLFLLFASGLATTLSWVFYYRALKDGLLTYVAVIDKGSLLVTLLLAFVLFKEPLTAKVLLGAGLMLAGMLVLVWK